MNFEAVCSAFPEITHDAASRNKRDSGYSQGSPGDYLDAVIAAQSASIPVLIDEGVARIERDLDKKVATSISWGMAIISGGIGDIMGDFIKAERNIGNLAGNDGSTPASVLLNYGFLFNYGLGFGLPFIVGLPSRKVDATGQDFTNVQHQYELLTVHKSSYNKAGFIYQHLSFIILQAKGGF